jgi:hypothetical protein
MYLTPVQQQLRKHIGQNGQNGVVAQRVVELVSRKGRDNVHLQALVLKKAKN